MATASATEFKQLGILGRRREPPMADALDLSVEGSRIIGLPSRVFDDPEVYLELSGLAQALIGHFEGQRVGPRYQTR